MRWQELAELRQDIQRNPGAYSPWIRIYIQQHYDLIASVAHPDNG